MGLLHKEFMWISLNSENEYSHTSTACLFHVYYRKTKSTTNAKWVKLLDATNNEANHTYTGRIQAVEFRRCGAWTE